MLNSTYFKKSNKKVKPNHDQPVERNQDFNSTTLNKILKFPKEVILSRLGSESLEPIDSHTTCSIVCSAENVFLKGFYNKFSRTLSQTPWVVDGKLMIPNSLQDEISKHVLPPFGSTDCKFHSGVSPKDSAFRIGSTPFEFGGLWLFYSSMMGFQSKREERTSM